MGCTPSAIPVGKRGYEALVFLKRPIPPKTVAPRIWSTRAADQRYALGALGELLECLMVEKMRAEGFVPKDSKATASELHAVGARATGQALYQKYPWERMWPSGLSAASLVWELEASGAFFDPARAYISIPDLVSLGLLAEKSGCEGGTRLRYQSSGQGASLLRTWQDPRGSFLTLGSDEVFAGIAGPDSRVARVSTELLEHLRKGEVTAP